VSAAVQARAPRLAAVQAIDPATLGALQANPFDQARAIQLLTSLASPDVLGDLTQITSYATTLESTSAAVQEEMAALERSSATAFRPVSGGQEADGFAGAARRAMSFQ
jgi:ACS family D-galactonate transporter-like MFS transporter